MDSVLSPLDLTARQAPEGPVAIARPHRVAAAASWFRDNFPGEVFYAVKANPAPEVLSLLASLGFGFDAGILPNVLMGLVAVLTLLSVGLYLAEWIRHIGSAGVGH